jgi:hypothetical protein
MSGKKTVANLRRLATLKIKVSPLANPRFFLLLCYRNHEETSSNPDQSLVVFP